MGGKHNTGGPDRSDEYESRQPPEEERREAIETVQEAVKRAEQAATDEASDAGATADDPATITVSEDRFDDWTEESRSIETNDAARYLGPTDTTSVDVDLDTIAPEKIEAEFDITLSETTACEDIHNSETNTTYPTFTYSEADEVRESLEDKHGTEPVDRVYDLMNRWKGSSGGEEAETLELIAKKALGISAPVRDDGKAAQEIPPDDAEIDVYRDATRISRSFLREHMPTDSDGNASVMVHRGIRHSNEALTAQLIDNPTASEYQFPTVSTSNHSIDVGVGDHWAEAYRISHRATPDDTAIAIDVLKPGGLDEGEIHIVGDKIRVPAAGLQFTGPRHQDIASQNAQELFSALDAPSMYSAETHDRIYELLRPMDRAGQHPETTAGTTRLKHWFESCIADDRFEEASNASVFSVVRSVLDSSGTDVTLDLEYDEV